MKPTFKYIIHTLTTIVLLNVVVGCHKDPEPVTNVISIYESGEKIVADGISIDTIYADLPINSMASSRSILFHSSSGLFSNSNDTLTITADRIDVHPGKVTAVAVWHAGLRSGLDTISASTNTSPRVTDFLSLTLAPSLADSIYLTASAYKVVSTFGMQVTITAVIYNKTGGMVSQDTKIGFFATPTIMSGGNGFFQPPSNLSGLSSSVTTFYSPPLLPANATDGNVITIGAAVIDAQGAPSSKLFTTKILISP